MSAWEYHVLRGGGWSADAVRDVVDRHGLQVSEVELLAFSGPAAKLADSVWEMVDVFRPHHLIVGHSAPADRAEPTDRAARAFGAACERAATHGVRVGIEFVPGTACPDLDTAVGVVTAAGHPNGGVVVDFFHHLSTGTPAELAPAAPYVVGVQLSDHRAVAGTRTHFEQWRDGGVLLGDGELEVGEAVTVLRAAGVCIPWSVEVLSDVLRRAPVEEVAGALASRARGFLDQHWQLVR